VRDERARISMELFIFMAFRLVNDLDLAHV